MCLLYKRDFGHTRDSAIETSGRCPGGSRRILEDDVCPIDFGRRFPTW